MNLTLLVTLWQLGWGRLTDRYKCNDHYLVLLKMCDRQDQLDEVELLQAMSKGDEFEWEEDSENGTISGTLHVTVHLDQPVSVRLIRKERVPRDKSEDGAPPLKHQHSDSSPAEVTAQVEHLPPFLLYFQLPSTYPSSVMPQYTLTCQWFNFTQLSQLCKSLDQVWTDNAGGVVLYNWQQLLAGEALSSLGIDSTSDICVEFEDPLAAKPEWDHRAIQDIVNPYTVIPSLVEYNETQKLLVFNDSFFDCEVCFIVKQGIKCARIASCQHIYCRECLSAYLKTKIEDGSVSKIECPTCSMLIQPSLIKELVSVDDFNRFDKLLLQRTLEGMSDVTYCPLPTCGCATVKEADSNMAQCPRCSFCFCALCRQTWHGVAPCKLLPQDLRELQEKWDAMDEAQKRLTAEKYGGRKKLETAFQEYESMKWVEKNSKCCPICSAKIQKTEGCNKMTCTQCMRYFCWLCDSPLPRLNPYSHYREGPYNKSKCMGKLFEGMTGFDFDDL